MSMNDNDYRPSYIWIHEGGKRKPDPKIERGIVYFDFLIIKTESVRFNGQKETVTVFFAAWGDSAHVAQTGTQFNDGEIMKTDCALHVGQIEKLFNEATEVTAILDHKVVYHDRLTFGA